MCLDLFTLYVVHRKLTNDACKKSCGEALFDDFIEVKPGALRELQNRLQEQNEVESADQEDHQFLRGRLKIIYKKLDTFITWISRQASTKMGVNQTNYELPLRRDPGPPINPANDEKILHLLLCIDKDEFWTRLYQQRLPCSNEDRDLFQFLREQYREHRGIVSRYSLRGVNNLSLAKVYTIHTTLSK